MSTHRPGSGRWGGGRFPSAGSRPGPWRSRHRPGPARRSDRRDPRRRTRDTPMLSGIEMMSPALKCFHLRFRPPSRLEGGGEPIALQPALDVEMEELLATRSCRPGPGAGCGAPRRRYRGGGRHRTLSASARRPANTVSLPAKGVSSAAAESTSSSVTLSCAGTSTTGPCREFGALPAGIDRRLLAPDDRADERRPSHGARVRLAPEPLGVGLVFREQRLRRVPAIEVVATEGGVIGLDGPGSPFL